jgi:hypothetical protein
VYECLFDGNIDPFIRKIIEFHSKKNILEFREYNESAFQTAIELLLPNEGFIIALIITAITTYCCCLKD